MEEGLTPSQRRRLVGEAWMHCSDCGAKLYSFDGEEDKGIPCPHPKKCREENT